MATQQSAASHARTLPIFHYFALPVLLINIAMAVNAVWRAPSLATGWGVLVAGALFVGALMGRVFALTAQDRVIRLEETLRMQRVLPAAQQADIAALTRYQFVALRFASDEELPDLVRRVRAGEFAKPIDIKKAIRSWRPDHLRV
ncbi:MAG: hypothetical protein IPK85_10380 [Gemmatimonadetes bacterium]|nr:hypothetical protein [Gemmatimonadota bacterium]